MGRILLMFIDADSTIQGCAALKVRSTINDGVGINTIDADSTIQGRAALKVRSTINGGVGINTALSIPVARANVKFHMLDGIEEISSTHE